MTQQWLLNKTYSLHKIISIAVCSPLNIIANSEYSLFYTVFILLTVFYKQTNISVCIISIIV